VIMNDRTTRGRAVEYLCDCKNFRLMAIRSPNVEQLCSTSYWQCIPRSMHGRWSHWWSVGLPDNCLLTVILLSLSDSPHLQDAEGWLGSEDLLIAPAFPHFLCTLAQSPTSRPAAGVL